MLKRHPAIVCIERLKWRLIAGAMLAGWAAISPIMVFAAADEGADQAMIYFRAKNANACNVYMNYSFYRPNFSLKAVNASALSNEQQRFITHFNAAFQALATRVGQSCQAPSNGAGGLNPQTAAALYKRCIALDDRLGISEGGWDVSRMPAPSNCISPKLAAPGVVTLIRASMPTPDMTLGSWITRAEQGH